ncbi:MAG: response regulator transcription factor [Chlorobi bacterium]|nr:response regulator transcription factor [Chlorobiota bacterium]
MNKILIIEDDPAISMGLSDSLTEENYEVDLEQDGGKGCQKALRGNYDLILLDIMLPSKNGIDICRDLRISGIDSAILMLTSKKEEMDKVIGLEIGADDYVTKPFSLRELKARIRALLRRKSGFTKEIDEYSFGNVKIDFKKFEAYKNGKPIQLSSTEFKIMKYFIRHEGEAISRSKFLDDVWGYDAFPTTRTVDNYMLSLRKLIEDDPAEPKNIITVHKIGYKFVK